MTLCWLLDKCQIYLWYERGTKRRELRQRYLLLLSLDSFLFVKSTSRCEMRDEIQSKANCAGPSSEAGKPLRWRVIGVQYIRYDFPFPKFSTLLDFSLSRTCPGLDDCRSSVLKIANRAVNAAPSEVQFVHGCLAYKNWFYVRACAQCSILEELMLG